MSAPAIVQQAVLCQESVLFPDRVCTWLYLRGGQGRAGLRSGHPPNIAGSMRVEVGGRCDARMGGMEMDVRPITHGLDVLSVSAFFSECLPLVNDLDVCGPYRAYGSGSSSNSIASRTTLGRCRHILPVMRAPG